MVRKEYRSHVGVILSILEAISSHQDIGITKIMLEANLPHNRAEDYLETLEKQGYISGEKHGRQTSYEVTKEGREFLESLKWTKSFFDDLGFPL